MLNLTELNNVALVVENTITIQNESGKLTFKVDDNVAEKIVALCMGKQVSEPASTKQEAPADIRAGYNDVKCKWSIEEITTPAGKRFYRINNGIYTYGKWQQSKFKADEEYRKTVNNEANVIANSKIKALQGVITVEMNGGWKAFGFNSKKAAEEALKKLPEKIQKVEIAEFVASHSADYIAKLTKTYTRKKIDQ